ncbi:phosphate transport system substrate-binding protein [Bhargavaea ginsengi]|uniref:Phosphate transport system substrate-binding protein n=1 Tax=Bhargavaea ginsengi TaxID=426757 RepID=A0A1H6YPT8_9BACL|nr:substrate-binding domain-containing protein [Bhargavaea ginsengi]SEJ43301.1 phosphate transport system substrate-binding protein [Bhargavaea ginsengi]
MKRVAQVLGFIGIVIFILFLSAPLLFMVLFAGGQAWFPVTVAGVLAVIFWFGFMVFGVRRKKVVLGIPLALLGIGLLIASPSLYKLTKPVVHADGVDLYEYAPFVEGTKAVSLDAPASFKMEGDLPVIDGATALYPLYASFTQAVYPEKDYEPYMSEVMSNRTGQAYESLINGEVDLIFVAGPSDAQLERARQAGKELELTPIGREAFVFFVNEDNPVESLTQEEIRDIYSGKVTNWKEVGGRSTEIRAYQRPPDSGSQTALEAFMGDTPIMAAPTEQTADLMSGIIEDVADYRNYGGAIGYTFRFYSQSMLGNDKVRLLAVDGVEPTADNIRSGDYPIVNELYVVTAGTDNPNVGPFIDWILSEEGQKIVERTGYVGNGK